MNGFMLLVLAVLAGQVGGGGVSMPPTATPVQPAAFSTPPPQRDYGWIIDKDNALVFIVQIGPDKESIMKSQNEVFECDIPPLVAARISRVIVKFGTELIPSTPLEQVERLPVVNRTELAGLLPTGQMKTLENNSDYSLQNVAGGVQPPPLSTGGAGSSLADATTSLNDAVADTLRDPNNQVAQNRNNPAASFLQDTMGTRAGAQTPPFTAPAPGVNPYAAPNNNGMPTSTATQPPAYGGNATQPTMPSFGAGAATGSSTLGIPGMGTAGLGTSGSGLGTVGNGASGVGVPGVGAGAAGSGYFGAGAGQAGNYAQQPPYSAAPGGSYTSLPAANPNYGGSSRTGFATAPVGTPQLNSTWQNNGVPYANANQNYAATQYGQSPSSYTGYPNAAAGTHLPTDPLSMRVADARSAIPGTSSTNGNVNSSRSTWGTQTNGYPNETDANGQPIPRSGVENVMPVMFVLSLVVNFYLGMLIRKLLGRYRTLLASVRSQTV